MFYRSWLCLFLTTFLFGPVLATAEPHSPAVAISGVTPGESLGSFLDKYPAANVVQDWTALCSPFPTVAYFESSQDLLVFSHDSLIRRVNGMRLDYADSKNSVKWSLLRGDKESLADQRFSEAGIVAEIRYDTNFSVRTVSVGRMDVTIRSQNGTISSFSLRLSR